MSSDKMESHEDRSILEERERENQDYLCTSEFIQPLLFTTFLVTFKAIFEVRDFCVVPLTRCLFNEPRSVCEVYLSHK